MFHEEFVLDITEDSPSAEYLVEDLVIKYYLPRFTEGVDELVKVITHEWLHGLIDWATEGNQEKDLVGKHDCSSESDHWIMRQLNY